jgi:histidinol-phosphate aminotransferase
MKEDLRRSFRGEILETEAYGVEEPQGLIKLDANENPYSPPKRVVAAMAESCRGLLLNRYPDPGAERLRALLADRTAWEKDGLMLGNGSDELIAVLCTACGHSDPRMVIPVPTFAMYRHIALVSGWSVEEVPLGENFDLNGDVLLEKIRGTSPRLVIIASPNNPTGNCFDEGVIREVIEEAPGLVVVDEAYFDFSGKTLLPLLGRHGNLIILRTLSKIGLAAIRLGFLLADPGIVRELNKVRLPYNVNAFSQEAASLVLEDPGYLNAEIGTIVSQRELLMAEMAGLGGISPFHSDANFILFRTRESSAAVFQRLRKNGVLVRDLGRPGPLENCLRVTVGTPEENRSFLTALRKSLV